VFHFGKRLQAPHFVGPHLFQFGSEWAQGLSIGAIPAEAAVGAGVHQAHLSEGAQVQGHGAKRHARHGAMNLASREFTGPCEAEDFPAARGRHGGHDQWMERHGQCFRSN
jgi:hypothetical protein